MLDDTTVEALTRASAHKLEALRSTLRGFPSALVAFSGGVDSTFVLKMAVEVLGAKALAMTALSPSVAPDEAKEAQALATELGARHLVVASNELDDPRYAANPTNRCYFCKTELYSICDRLQAEHGLAVVLDGFNADDKKDHRPGHQAAREHAVRSPLAEVGLTKDEIRAWSKQLGLPTWDKPQLACLASRLPYGTAVTAERLTQVGRAEAAVRALGFRIFRVRHHGELARLEFEAAELEGALSADRRGALDRAIKACGYTFVAVDLEPFRSGRLNDVLPQASIRLPIVS